MKDEMDASLNGAVGDEEKAAAGYAELAAAKKEEISPLQKLPIYILPLIFPHVFPHVLYFLNKSLQIVYSIFHESHHVSTIVFV